MTTRQCYGVSPQEFVTVWRASDSVTEVAERLKMARAAVYARASTYRKKGVLLKQMQRRGRPRLNVEALNQAIQAA